MLVINAAYSELRTRVLTAFFALLILRPSKIPLKTKGRALFCRYRHHSTENFLHQRPSSQPKMGVIPAKANPDFRLSCVFAGFHHFIGTAPLLRSDLLLSDRAHHILREGKKSKGRDKGNFSVLSLKLFLIGRSGKGGFYSNKTTRLQRILGF